MLRYSNTGETVGSSILTTKDVTKITEKIFKVCILPYTSNTYSSDRNVSVAFILITN